MKLISQKLFIFVAGCWHLLWNFLTKSEILPYAKRLTPSGALVFLILIIISLPPSIAHDLMRLRESVDHSYGTTTEIYLPPGVELPSGESNTLYVNRDEIGIVLGDGTKENVTATRRGANKDIYLTIKYLLNTDTLYFYNHGEKIGTISLKGKDFNVREMIEDLNEKNVTAYRRDGEPANGVSFFKSYNTPLSDKRIKLNYERTYPTIKISPSQNADTPTRPNADTGPESHLLAYTVSTTGLVLNLDASNLNNAGNFADSSDTATTWTDRSGNGNNGTLTNFTLPSDANGGWKGANTSSDPSVLHFDGTNDYVNVSNSNSLDITGNVTISFWINVDGSAGYGEVLAKGDYIAGTGTSSYFSVIIPTTNIIRFGINLGGAGEFIDSNMAITVGRWTNITYTFNPTSNDVAIYYDGSLDASGTITPNPSPNSHPLYIGALKNSTGALNQLDGKISNLRIYSTALSAEQIRTNYLAEAYKFQGTDNVAPGIYGEEDLRTSAYKKSQDSFDVYVEDVNPVANGDSDVNGINSLSCMLGSTSLTTPSATEQNFTGGLTFDGSNDYVDCGTIDAGQVYTISAWIKSKAGYTADDVIVSSYNAAATIAQYDLRLRSSNGLGIFYQNASGYRLGNTSANVITSGQWYHVAWTNTASSDAGQILYVNGSPVSLTFSNSATPGAPPTSGFGNTAIGRTGSASLHYFDGQISNVRIYNRALSAAEISRDYRSPYEPSNPTGLVAWYKLDDGNVSSNTTTTAAARKWDTTTNSIVTDATLNGTLTNFGFGSANGWVNQYSFNRNKYTFTVPTLTGANQVEKLQCTATDAWSNSTTTNEEVGGVFVTRSNPTVSTNVTANSTIMTGDTIAVTVLDNTPDSSILSSPTTPTATIDGNSFSTTCSITPTTVSKAETFDGVDDYVEISNSSSLNLTSVFAISLWMKRNAVTSGRGSLFANCYSSGCSDLDFGFQTATNSTNVNLKFVDSNGSGREGTQVNVPSGQWNHLVGQYDGEKLQFYLNGSLQANDTYSGLMIVNTSSPIYIGRHNIDGAAYFNGSLDDIQIYNRALSANEISYLYNNPGKLFNGNGLVGYWRFDQLEDTNSNSVSDNVRDYSSNSNHGTLTNYSSLSSALVDSTVTGSIDGRTGSCNIEITNSNPTGPSNVTSKSLVTSATNAISLTGTETKTVSLSRNLAPTTPRVSSAMLNTESLSNDLTVFNTEHGDLLVVNFTASDSDVSDTITLSTVTTPSIGRFEAMSGNPASATFTYSPSYNDSGMAYTFSVRASDGTANSASDLSITVNAPRGYPYNPPAIQPGSTTEVKSENKPTTVVVIPPTKPNEPDKPQDPGTQGPPRPPGDNKPPKDEPKKPEVSIPFIEAAFPEVPDFKPVPDDGKDETAMGRPGETAKDKPTQTNVILAGSENTFALAGNSEVAQELKNIFLSEVEVLVTITDSAGHKQIVPATVLVAAGKNDNSPVVINTEQISQNLAEGQAIIELSINGVPKAQINVVISKSQLRSESEIVADLNKPFILSVKAIRKGEFLKVLITGSNFFDKELNVNGVPITTAEKLTEISMLPNNGIQRVQMKIKSKNLIVATYKIKNTKKISRNLVLTITNPYGRAVSTFEVPKR